MKPAAFKEDGRVPVHVLTGFLGSGKTTFLKHLLTASDLADTAVVINEFGEVGLDHLLVREVSEDVVLLSSGCLCCAVRDDLVSTLADLLTMVRTGEVKPFRRVVVETTGLADPAPVMHAVMSDLQLRRGYRAGMIIATLDGVGGMDALRRHPEALQQIALADRIVVTKVDLVEDWRLKALMKEAVRINPSAPCISSGPGSMPDGDGIFCRQENWQERHLEEAPIGVPEGVHSVGVETFAIELSGTVDWSMFVDWLELLLANRGQSILRVKGLIAIEGEARPVVIQGVQHTIYPPEFLPGWPDRNAGPWLVFIAYNLTRTAVENSLKGILYPTPRPG